MQALYYLVLILASLSLQQLHAHKQGMNFLKSSTKTNDRLVWDSTTLQRLSPKEAAAFYPRMIALKRGALLLAYASAGNIIVRKKDPGKAWTAPVIVAAQQDGVNRDTPELLELQNGAILLCYGSRPQRAMQGTPQNGKYFDIRIKTSTNGGEAWSFEKVLYRADSLANNGCWEPAAVQLPSGEIQLFFANEAIYKTTNEQNISLLRSWNNGKTWTRSPQIVSFRKGSRDGMPVPIWNTKTQQVVVAIEDPAVQNFKPYLIYSEPGGRWRKTVGATDTARQYALANKLPDSVYAGAPYLRQLHSGKTVLSYQSTEGRSPHTDRAARMVVVISNSNGQPFTAPSFPFRVPLGANALWNSLCVLNDDTILALTSTNAFSAGRSEVWMIQGRLQPDTLYLKPQHTLTP